tara:strand:- start:501 stop:3368 length:2868 start_codon:yes stop_codon:yes gene_type:complete
MKDDIKENVEDRVEPTSIDEEMTVGVQPRAEETAFSFGDNQLEHEQLLSPVKGGNELITIPRLKKTKQQRKKERQAELKRLIKAKKIITVLKPIISIDTEYEQRGDENMVLSYQYVVSFRGKRCQGIHFTKSGHKRDRLSFEKFLVIAIEAALKEEVLTKWSDAESVILVAHYLKADLFTFSNSFKDIKTLVSSVRKTVASLKDSYAVDLSKELKKRIDDKQFNLNDKNNNAHPVLITLFDSMLFAPAGYQSLAKIGELVNCAKRVILPPYSITRMSEYLVGDRENYIEYAINDAMISCLHLEKVIDYECVQNDSKHLSFTIGSLAVKAFKQTILTDYKARYGITDAIKVNNKGFKQYFNRLLGKESVTSEQWVKKVNSDEYQAITKTDDVLTDPAYIFQTMAIECYHGGRNECYITGPTAIDNWYDFDAPSCYTVMLNGIKPIDYDNIIMSRDINDFLDVEGYGLLRLRFKFPDNTEYPSLPVRADPYGLVYPLEGICYCTHFELIVALSQNATIEVLQGFIIPWLDNDHRIFTPFMKQVRAKRVHYKTKKHADDFLEKYWKEKGNSCYGRLAMGLRDKRVFDIQEGNMKKLETGELTNAYFAAYVSGGARALLSALLAGVPEDKQVIALTTDGFTTNATLDDIYKLSPVCDYFREMFHMIDPKGGEVLEMKHKMHQVLAFKTRGYTTTIRSINIKDDFISARAGTQLPDGMNDSVEANSWMNEIYLNRTPTGEQSKFKTHNLTPLAKMARKEKDNVTEYGVQRLSLEPDYKRDLIPNGMVDVCKTSHLQCLSKPHKTVADMILKRQRFDGWCKLGNNLKNEQDWANWYEYYKLSTSLKGTAIRIIKDEDSANVFKRMFLRVWGKEQCGVIMDMKQSHFADWLSNLDDGAYPTKPSAVSSAKKEGACPVIYGIFPATERIAKLLKHLVERYPSFSYEQLFKPDEIDELRQLMSK